MCHMALNRMCEHSRKAGITVEVRPYGNALIHRARNNALASIRPDSTHALFVDDDMLPRENALCNLLACDEPVVSALCTTRVDPVEIAAKVYAADSDQFHPLETVNLGKVVSGPFAVGAAFLLFQRATADKLIEYYLSAQDWIAENRRTLDRLKVRSENRESERKRMEEVRRASFERERYCRVFDYPVIENQMQLGEDVSYSRKLLQLGIPVAIDGRTIVGHLGVKPYTVHDIIERENRTC